MFRGTQSTAPDTSFSATRHIPVTDCQPSDFQAGLWFNAVLVGLSAPGALRRLQSVLNAAARLVCHMTSADHITDALIEPLAAAVSRHKPP